MADADPALVPLLLGESLPPPVWLALGCIAAAAVLAMLHVLAIAVRNATAVHDLQVRAATLRRRFAENLENEEPIPVEIVDEGE